MDICIKLDSGHILLIRILISSRLQELSIISYIFCDQFQFLPSAWLMVVISHVNNVIGYCCALIIFFGFEFYLGVWFFDQLFRVYSDAFACLFGFLMHLKRRCIYEDLFTIPCRLILRNFKHLRHNIAGGTIFVSVSCHLTISNTVFLKTIFHHL